MERNLQLCIDFHGHLCPGLLLGYKASILAMELLKEERAKDEELVAIVENDSCFADAVQVITGCTFGKGNFIFRDFGKMALSLVSRGTERGIRISLKKNLFESESSREERSKKILQMNPQELFDIERIEIKLPERAKIERSKPCSICGEPTQESKLVKKEGREICKGCLAEKEIR